MFFDGSKLSGSTGFDFFNSEQNESYGFVFNFRLSWQLWHKILLYVKDYEIENSVDT